MLIGALAAAGSARADVITGQAATVRFLSNMFGHLDWRGRGDTSLQHVFCVESATGRFVLDVSSSAGGLNGEAVIPYEVTVEMNGRSHTGVISQATPVMSIQGETPRDNNCQAPSQVGILTVRLLQKDVMGAVSGSYADQLSVSVASN